MNTTQKKYKRINVANTITPQWVPINLTSRMDSVENPVDGRFTNVTSPEYSVKTFIDRSDTKKPFRDRIKYR